jgi:CTP synthase (UTP-ammonia lyase)
MPSSIRIGLIGDYDPTKETHQVTSAALDHAAAQLGRPLEAVWLPTSSLDPLPADAVRSYDGLWCAPGSPYHSMTGALNAIRWAREQDWPLLGTCGGFQHMVIEYVRHVLLVANAQHAEYGPTTDPLVVTPLSCSLRGQTLEIRVEPESQVGGIYRQSHIQESYYCTYGLDPAYQQRIHDAGLRVVGTDQDGEARIVELPGHRFFVGTLFVPQRQSTPERPHPLVVAFVEAAGQVNTNRPSVAGITTGA